MKICCHLACLLTIACTLTGCQSLGRSASSILSMPRRVLQMAGRTVGGLTQTDSPDTSLEAIALRGQQIEQRAATVAPTAPALFNRTAVVQR